MTRCMKKCWIAGFLLLAVAGPALEAAEPTGAQPATVPFSVRPCGLQIVAPGYGEGDGQLRAFNWTEGTQVALLFRITEGGLIGFDDKKSKVTLWADDTGLDLLKGKDGESDDDPISSFPKASADGKAFLIELEGKGVPAPKARAIRVKGTFLFNVGSKTEKFETKSVALKEGSEIKAGKIKFVIKKAEKPSDADEPMELEIEAKQSLEALAAIRFLDSAGERIETAIVGSSTSKFFGSVTEERSLKLKKAVDAATVEIMLWADARSVEVPVDLTIGLGMPAD